MTNADYIRSMSDEELAEFIHDIYRDGVDNGECEMLGLDFNQITIDGLMQWLQEEYKEDV